jgi:AraC-like DNA-binding protein
MVGLVPPVEPGVLIAEPEDPYLHYYCRFAGSYALALAAELIAAREERFAPCLVASRVADCMARMGPIHRTELPDAVGTPEAALAEALAELRHAPRLAPEALSPGSLEEHLRATLQRPIDLDRVAAHFGVSRSTLCRASRRGFGIGVQALHERLKIRWAATLLAHGLSVAECARRVGYADRRYFTRVFRAQRGVPPSAVPPVRASPRPDGA